MSDKSDLTIVGAGCMGSALVRGLLSSQQFTISICDQHPEHLDIYQNLPQVRTCGLIKDLADKIELLILAVKPHDLAAIAPELKNKITPNTLIISLLAGIKMDAIKNALNHNGPLVRAMPNLGATVGMATTALARNERVSGQDADKSLAVFDSVGTSHWIAEDLLNVVTALSGSGPAYVFMMIEAMTDGGVKMGLPREVALKLASHTVRGAAELLIQSGEHPAVLRDQVITPAGTTIHAIHMLEEHGFRSTIISAIESAAEQAVKLGPK
jgi:pyrroline-5-carboxylate reductase